jgi:glycine cleavage system aminomethyltransferase T
VAGRSGSGRRRRCGSRPASGLERALDYSKCYVGQEVVARIRTYGHANRALAGLRARRDEPIAAGAPLRAGDAEAGRVTSAVRSPRCGAIALGMVRRQFLTAGTELQVAEDDSARTEVEVVPLPFVGGAPPSSA